GSLPEGNGLISWIPADLAAAAIVEMQETSNKMLHLVHPKPSNWGTIMTHLEKLLNVPLVPYEEWFAHLE
ncbi:hypothetical protein BDZ97DRAFT_1636524, partial [Flammula alnicola]